MKKLFQSAFCLVLTVTFVAGAMLVLAPEARAFGTCPTCYAPPNASGWSQYGTCDDFSDPHCPLLYRQYKNTSTGQVCRGQFPIANI